MLRITKTAAELEEFYESFFGAGASVEKGIGEEDVCPIQLGMGIAIEHEHTDNSMIARKIALDHLAEDPAYYTHLIEMERKYK